MHAAGITLNYETVKAGLSSTLWPGRFERVDFSAEEHSSTTILDIAHNPAAARALAATWRGEFGRTKANLIFGAVEAKDIEGILEALAPIAGHLHFAPVNSPRALAPEELATFLPEEAPAFTIHASLQSALESSTNLPSLITGSAFLIGEVKALHGRTAHRITTQ